MRTSPLRVALGLLLLLTAGVQALPAVSAGAATTTVRPAVFEVGAAVRSIRPVGAAMKTHVGGYGDCLDCVATGGTTAVRRGDDLDVRVLYVSNGERAVVRVSVTAEGWFAGYQQGPRLGLTDLRAEAARKLTRAGLAVSPSDLIVNSNHCHACPTLVGIWGPTNTAYLRYVYDQTVQAILDAQRAARPATLTWAIGDLGYANDVTVGQANANEGWPIDGQLSTLQAKDSRTGATLATYVEVPVHGNIVFGPDLQEMNSEHFGAAARYLERTAGGVGIVAAGTLGDQTSPMQGDDTRLAGDSRKPFPRARPGNKTPAGYPRAYDVIDRLGALAGATALEALRAHGHPITDRTVSSGESYQLVPSTNPIVLGLMYAHTVPGVGSGPDAAVIGADRSVVPPYAVGNAIGVWFTVLRIGDVALASQPGEAFPHVSAAMRATLSGASAVFLTSNAQDQLGYYFEPWALPSTLYYSADHYTFYLGPTFAQQQINGTMLSGRTAGFATAPTVSSYADAAANDYLRYFRGAGVQTWAYPRGAGDVPLAPRTKGIPVFLGIYFNSARGSESGFPGAEVATGNPRVQVDGVEVPYRGEFTPYTFPCAGDYTITASLPGTSATWKSVAHVRDAVTVTNTAFYPEGTGPHPLALQNLGDGPGKPRCGRAVTAAPIQGSAVAAPVDYAVVRPLAARTLPSTGAGVPTALAGLLMIVVAGMSHRRRRA